MYIVEVNMPNLATGVSVEIDGLGFFENGKEHAISADEAAAYRARHVRQETTTDKEGRLIQNLVEAPTLLQAFKKFEGINVRSMTKEEREVFNADDEPVVQDEDENVEGDESKGDDQ